MEMHSTHHTIASETHGMAGYQRDVLRTCRAAAEGSAAMGVYVHVRTQHRNVFSDAEPLLEPGMIHSPHKAPNKEAK